MGTSDHPLLYWRKKNRYYYQDLDQLIRFLVPANQRVLEIGSGTGVLLNSLWPRYGLGIDRDPAAVQLAKQRFPHLAFQVQDAHGLQIADLKEPFDTILLINTLGTCEDVQQVLERLRPLCSPMTRLVISYHNPLWEGLLQWASKFKQRMALPSTNWLSQGDMGNLLDLAGFEIVRQGKQLLMPRRIPGISGLINGWIAPLPGINSLCLTEFIVARLQPQIAGEAWINHLTCSVVIPARNEAGNIANCVRTLPPMGKHTEIIFVEGNSTDETWNEIQKVRSQWRDQIDIKMLQQQGKGKADAVRLGFEAASGDVLIILDADLTVQAEEMPKFFRAVASGRCDLANGCRLVYPLDQRTMPYLNQWANRFFARLLSYVLGIRIKDSLCGTKVLRRSDYLEIAANRQFFGDFDPFGDFDLLLGATKLNLKIVDIPVRYHPRVYGSSNIRHVQEGFRLLRICWFAARKFRFH